MAAGFLEVTLHLDRSLNIQITKQLPHGTKVAELKEQLAQDDPTGNTRPQDLTLKAVDGPILGDAEAITDKLLELELCSGEAAAAEAPVEPAEYRVVQGPLFKKPGTDPASEKIIGLKRKVGSTVKTTGRTWQGASGGEWVELAPSTGEKPEKPGWFLVEGPGFNQPGPLLEKIVPGEEPPVVLKLFSLITKSVLCEVPVKPSQTIRAVKWWIALRDPHKLKLDKILVARQMPSEEEQGNFSIASFPTSNLHQDANTVDGSFKDGDSVPYFYMGEASDDGAFS
mmetsp:Transcript_92910/g.271969  ORF Transcript_92910/g.271969 Transcript_92910/m.271969 type:complete len:283 (+) Transcript_92910:83-931(+)